MSEKLENDIEKEVKNNSDSDKVEKKKEAKRKYQEDMVRYMNGITLVKQNKIIIISFVMITITIIIKMIN